MFSFKKTVTPKVVIVPASFITQYNLPTATEKDQELNKKFFELSEKLKSTHFTETEQIECEYINNTITAERFPIFWKARQKAYDFRTIATEMVDLALSNSRYTFVCLDSLEHAIPSKNMRMSNGTDIGEIVIYTIFECLQRLAQNGISAAIRSVEIANNIKQTWQRLEIDYRAQDFGNAICQQYLPARYHNSVRTYPGSLEQLIERLTALKARLMFIGAVTRVAHSRTYTTDPRTGQVTIGEVGSAYPLASRFASAAAITDEDDSEFAAYGVEESKGDE
jgi:hypothetical protein